MMFFLVSLGFGVFTLIYVFFAAAIVYHLRAYSLPGWSVGRIGVILFILISLVLFAFAAAAFLRVPWDAYLLDSRYWGA